MGRKEVGGVSESPSDGPMTLETRLIEIVRADAGLMHVLSVMRDLNLPDWRLFSGAVYQAVWNAQTGRATGYGVKATTSAISIPTPRGTPRMW